MSVIGAVPLDAIDPEAGYRQWMNEFLWHIDQIPNLVDSVGVLALPRLRAAKLQERVGGGGYFDNIPIADLGATRDTAMLWAALRAYLASAASHLGVEGPILPLSVPEDIDDARAWAHDARAWLALIVEHIRAWPDLNELESTLFTLIRRISGRRPEIAEPAVEMERCGACGQESVLIDWIAAPDGQRMLAKACTVCGTRYGSYRDTNQSEMEPDRG